MKRNTIVIWILVSVSLFLLSCGLSETVIKATAQAEIYQTQTQQAEKAAIVATQTSMAITQSAMAITPTVKSTDVPPTASPTLTPTKVAPASAPPASEPPAPAPPASEPPPSQAPAPAPSISWTIDTTGVCRDDYGQYPRWSEYNWTLAQCSEACQNNPNCQGFAMSKSSNYCQLFGSDGQYDGSSSNVQISRGDQAQSTYSCYLKSGNASIFAWAMDSSGVCRDGGGNYPRWSEYYWSYGQCSDACQNNPNCQGFAMSKKANYCQLFGSDGQYDGSNPGTQIILGDSSQSEYTCFIRR